MKPHELRAWIESLAQDIDFEYQGITGSICPFSKTNISLAYDGNELTVHSVDDAMTKTFIRGHSLEEVCEELII